MNLCRQPQEYKDEVLPPSCRHRVAVEAGATGLWWKYVGLDGDVVGIDRFGASAPGPIGVPTPHCSQVMRRHEPMADGSWHNGGSCFGEWHSGDFLATGGGSHWRHRGCSFLFTSHFV